MDHHLGDLAMETEHRSQSRLAKNQNRRHQGISPNVDGEDHSAAAVGSSSPAAQMQGPDTFTSGFAPESVLSGNDASGFTPFPNSGGEVHECYIDLQDE